MAIFIKLTSAMPVAGANSIHFNLDHIESVAPATSRTLPPGSLKPGGSEVTTGSESAFLVVETPEQVMALIKEAQEVSMQARFSVCGGETLKAEVPECCRGG